MNLSRQYDDVFARHAGRLPVAYLRALAQRESSMNPKLVMPGGTGAARGLLQVVGVLRQHYNEVNRTNYTADDLLDPDTNVKIASWLLNRIVAGYQKHSDANLREDWNNPEFVKLVTAGWNAGYSEAAGVGKVASALEAQGRRVTLDNVFSTAESVGAVKWLTIPARKQWHESVANLYLLQPDRGHRAAGTAVVLLALVATGAYYYYWSRK